MTHAWTRGVASMFACRSQGSSVWLTMLPSIAASPSGRGSCVLWCLTRTERVDCGNGCTRRSLGFAGVRSPDTKTVQNTGFGERERTRDERGGLTWPQP